LKAYLSFFVFLNIQKENETHFRQNNSSLHMKVFAELIIGMTKLLETKFPWETLPKQRISAERLNIYHVIISLKRIELWEFLQLRFYAEDTIIYNKGGSSNFSKIPKHQYLLYLMIAYTYLYLITNNRNMAND
jgi:hypothetical protein